MNILGSSCNKRRLLLLLSLLFMTDFKLRMGFVIKAENDWPAVGRPQLAICRNCHLFICSMTATWQRNIDLFIH